MIKELEKKFGRESNCLGEITEKYKTFSVPRTREEKRIDKYEKEIRKTSSYKLQFIDSARYMIYKFSNRNIRSHILLLRKGVCECMDDWEKFNET